MLVVNDSFTMVVVFNVFNNRTTKNNSDLLLDAPSLGSLFIIIKVDNKEEYQMSNDKSGHVEFNA